MAPQLGGEPAVVTRRAVPADDVIGVEIACRDRDISRSRHLAAFRAGPGVPLVVPAAVFPALGVATQAGTDRRAFFDLLGTGASRTVAPCQLRACSWTSRLRPCTRWSRGSPRWTRPASRFSRSAPCRPAASRRICRRPPTPCVRREAVRPWPARFQPWRRGSMRPFEPSPELRGPPPALHPASARAKAAAGRTKAHLRKAERVIGYFPCHCVIPAVVDRNP